MSEPGTPSKTATASKESRISRLFGSDFEVHIRQLPGGQYLVTAIKTQYAHWTMVEEDFDHYTDDQLLEKFINPAKGVFK